MPLNTPSARAFAEHGISLGGVSHLRPKYRMSRNNPNHHIFLCTASGHAILQTESEEYVLTPGSCLILPAGAPHCYQVKTGKWKLLWLHLTQAPVWRGLETCTRFFEIKISPPTLEYHFSNYINENLSEETGHQLAAESHANLICTILKRAIHTVHPIFTERKVDPRLLELWNKVNADIARNWDSSEFCRTVHISRGHLHRLCIEQHGISPMQLLRKLRMERASTLLRNTDYTVDFIATLTGYSSAYALSKAFKNYFGVCPRTYRNHE